MINTEGLDGELSLVVVMVLVEEGVAEVDLEGIKSC